VAPAWQVVLFAVALLFFLAVLRPIAQRTLKARGVPSRTDTLIGRRGQVIQAIDPVVGTGRVNVGGDDWAARCSAPVAAGAEVVVNGADGIVLLVSPAAPSRPLKTDD
jgi:membrane protein implicated in regulation of membrane protease activity